MARRVIDLYYDVNQKLLRNSSGKVLSSLLYPHVTRLEDVLFRVRLVTNANLTAYTGISASDTITATIDVDRAIDESDEFMAYAGASSVNVDGDWVGDSSGDDQASVAEGEITIRMDMDTSRAATVFSTKEAVLNGVLEIRVQDGSSSGANSFHLYQIPVVLRNSQSIVGAAETVAGPSGSTGLVNISSGVTTHTVSSLEWASTPIVVEATVVAPNGGVPVFVTKVDTITTTGFIAYFSSQVPASGYKLFYRAVFS